MCVRVGAGGWLGGRGRGGSISHVSCSTVQMADINMFHRIHNVLPIGQMAVGELVNSHHKGLIFKSASEETSELVSR